MKLQHRVGIDVSGKTVEVFVHPSQRVLKVTNSLDPCAGQTALGIVQHAASGLHVLRTETCDWRHGKSAFFAYCCGPAYGKSLRSPNQKHSLERGTQTTPTKPIKETLLPGFLGGFFLVKIGASAPITRAHEIRSSLGSLRSCTRLRRSVGAADPMA